MFDIFKNNAKKELKCLNSLKFLLDENTINFNNEVNGVIRYHSVNDVIEGLNNSVLGNPLYHIKSFYVKHLDECEKRLKVNPNDVNIKGMAESDKVLLSALTDDYIRKYDDVISNIYVVDKLGKYLSDDKKDLLDKFNGIYHNQVKEENKVRK